MKNIQVAIIGGGVIGSAIAWELSKYKVDVVVFEKGSDVAFGSSKANSGVIHSGINSSTGSLKAHYCVKGNLIFKTLADQLGFRLKFVGKWVIAKNENEVKELENLKKIGIGNKVPNLEIVDGSDFKKKEPNVSCYNALWVPTAGIILPYEFTIALAENAAENGVNFSLENEVKDIKKQNDVFKIVTQKGEFQSKIIINSAGLNCRNIVSMLETPDFEIYPCRGEYLILDKNYSSLINSMIYPIPDKKLGVLGIHITPTIEGNILLGPSAEFIDEFDDKRTTKEMMKTLFDEAKEIIPNLPSKSVISAYSGIRCKIASPKHGGWADYRIEESKITNGLINLIGIESPGLTSAPAIAKDILKMVSHHIDLVRKNTHIKRQFYRKRFSEMTLEEKNKMIKDDASWGRVICRCENVTEVEVINALSNPIGAKSLSSVKYRCRAGMGRCQGGFCTQHIVRIMEERFGIDVSDIKLKSADSNVFYKRTRECKK